MRGGVGNACRVDRGFLGDRGGYWSVSARVDLGREEDGIFQLIHHLYEASIDPNSWPVILDNFCAVFHAAASVFASYDFASGTVRRYHSVGIAPEYLESYSNCVTNCAPWAEQEPNLRTPGVVAIGSQLISTDELAGTTFYTDWLRPQGLLHSIRGIVHREERRIWSLSLARMNSAPDFDDEDTKLFGLLMPHVLRSFQLGRQLNDQKALNEAAMAALDHMPIGVALVGPDGKVFAANRLAEEITAEGDGLAVGPGGLYARHNGEKILLQELIASAVATTRFKGSVPGGVIAVSRESGLRPFSVRVAPVRNPGDLFGVRRGAAAVFIGDPERRVDPDPAQLVSLYQLTPAEARLAARLASGGRLDEVAESLGIKYETARTHLKRVFGKTGTDRQSDLIHLIQSSPALFRPNMTGAAKGRLRKAG